MTSLDKLNVSQLPPHEAFFSTLKNENISAEDYQLCQRVWEDNGNADAVFKHIDVAILVKLKHLVDGFQHGFDVFVVVPCQELFHGLHVVVE
jgi:hypothetical protein